MMLRTLAVCMSAVALAQGEDDKLCSAPEKSMKLTYFGAPGRAEPIRLALAVGGIKFEDNTLTGAQWGEMKPKVAPLQLPQLEIDGKVVAQSMAILRYAGKIAKYEGKPLYPEDPFEALLVDEMIDFANEVFPPLSAAYARPEGEERNTALIDTVKAGGAVEKWAAYIDSLLAKSKTGYAVLDRFTSADIAIFTLFSGVRIGIFDVIPKDCLDHLENLLKHKEKIGALKPVADYYSDATGLQTYFKN